MQQLSGKVAVITGAGSGIGEGMAHEFAAEGMKVVVADVEDGRANAVANAVKAAGGEAIGVRADVSDRASVEALAERAYQAFGAVHLLCNNAGVMMVAPIADTRLSDWEWTFSVNMYGVVNGVQVFVPRMRQQGGEAHIVNTASQAGLHPIRGGFTIGTYTASKYAVVGISETLREELAPDGIGVSVLCPGGVDTKIFTAERNRPSKFGGPAPAEQLEQTDAVRQENRPQMMDPRQVGRIVLAGVRANRAYILTHQSMREPVQERFREIMSDYEAAPADA